MLTGGALPSWVMNGWKMSNYSDSAFDESSENTSWYKVFKLVPESSTVLDIGCSSGNFGQVLIERKACTVDGVELDSKDAKTAAKKLRNVWQLNVEYDDIKPLGNGRYDVIYFGDVVEHLVDPIATLQRIKHLLKPTGVILFSIPNMGHIGIRLALLAGDFEYTETGLLDKTHLHFYTQPEVKRVYESAGYRINHLDFVKKDYPKELLKKYLEKYGLKANEDFYKRMAQTDASAFQFVGTAIPASVKNHKLKQFGPIDLFEKFHEDTKKNYESEISNLNERLSYHERHPFRTAAGHVKRKLKP